MRIEVVYRSRGLDGRAGRLAVSLGHSLGAPLGGVYLVDVYLVEGVPELDAPLAVDLFSDPVAQEVYIDETQALLERFPKATLAVEVSSKPGVTDPVALTARKAIETAIGRRLSADGVVQSARMTVLELTEVSNAAAALSVASLHNPLIEQAVTLTRAEWESGKGFPSLYEHRVAPSPSKVERFDLTDLSEGELAALSRRRLLALEPPEMEALRRYFADEKTLAERRRRGLDRRTTDVELEMLAQTWSEHCKHKIFNATIHYTEKGRSETIHSLFATYIRSTTEKLAPQKPFLRSVFHDNSGVIAFDEEHLLCFKAETHNSPSALDPYGGAITGIVGVNRDILGTGKGAKPIFNTDVLCFGPPDTPEERVAEGLLPPRRVLHGVHHGIIDGGNQSGIPVVAGAFLFDESFLGKPLVFCGTGGILPSEIAGEAAWVKHIDAGDLAVMVGGRVGKDGIHGATFSSLALDETSPTSAVQIGDPITQKRMSDFLLEARDLGLYKGITDNGAGGLSSSLGEMAELSGGVRIALEACPLKYPGLAPWEILVSESQERMSLAVDPARIGELLALAARRDVEATVIGEFTDSGYVEVRYGEETVGLVSLEFLHHGLPTMELNAQWNGPAPRSLPRAEQARRDESLPPQAEGLPERTGGLPTEGAGELKETLLRLLGDPSIASKEALVRQYDHEVQGSSVVKPFVGEMSDGPGDGAVLRPVAGSTRGVTVTHGICPAYGDIDPYDMAMCAVDEAFRAHIALGGNPDLASALDNFCWPDPVESERTPDGAYKLAQLVRACRGLADSCLAYGLPLISGKDSMKNDAILGGRKVSIRPTLLVSLMGIIDDLRAALTSDFKRPGDLIYLAGATRGELGGSAYERLAGRDLGGGPRVQPKEAMLLYRAFHTAAREGLVASCHDLAEGGLAVALAESAFGGRLGAEVDLRALPLDAGGPDGTPGPAASSQMVTTGDQTASAPAPYDPRVGDHERRLFCESPSRLLVSVRSEEQRRFEGHFPTGELRRIGTVTEEQRLVVRDGQKGVMSVGLEELGAAWKGYEW